MFLINSFGSCLKVVRMVTCLHDFPYHRLVGREREQPLARSLFSPPGVWLSTVPGRGRAGAYVSSVQAGLSRLSVQSLRPGLQPLHWDDLCRRPVVSQPSRLAAPWCVQGREQCQPSRGTRSVSEHGPSLTAEGAGQWVHPVGRAAGPRCRDRDRRDVSECGGKKASLTPTPTIPPAAGPTSGAGMAPMRMIGRRWWEQWDVAPGTVVCGCANRPMGARCALTSNATPARRGAATPMSGKATTAFPVLTSPSATARRSG